MRDRRGLGTGFTTFARRSNGRGYVRSKLVLNRRVGALRVRTTAGLAYQSENAQDNALAVGVKARTQTVVIRSTLVRPPAGSGHFEQAGVWFGINQDNYVKLVLLSRQQGSVIQFLAEVNGARSGAARETGVIRVRRARVALTLRANPFSGTVAGSYRVNRGRARALGSVSVPSEFFSTDAAGIDPRIGTRSFGGILASHVNGPRSLVYTFANFSATAIRRRRPAPSPSPGGIAFTRSAFAVPSPTSMTWGRDGRLYVTSLLGTIHAFRFNRAKRVIGHQVIQTLGRRLTLGIAVDPRSTRRHIVLWVSSSSPSLTNGAANSGTITRLSGRGFRVRRDVITGLPRAVANHATNSIHFGPGGNLYIAQGGNTGGGAPSNHPSYLAEFGSRPEQPLSAAILVANVRMRGFDGSCATPIGSFSSACDVHPFATGLRNTYDFVWHSNGSMYGADNGLSVNGSTYPPSPRAPCTGNGDPRLTTQGGDFPGEQPDPLNRIVRGGYYGHPNPYRRQCVFKDGHYQHVSALRNYRPPIYDLGRKMSYNGIIEYRSRAFGGALRGELLITSYSRGQHVLRVRLSPNGTRVVRASVLVGNLNDPLPIAQGPDGTIYVGELGADRVTVLRPRR